MTVVTVIFKLCRQLFIYRQTKLRHGNGRGHGYRRILHQGMPHSRQRMLVNGHPFLHHAVYHINRILCHFHARRIQRFLDRRIKGRPAGIWFYGNRIAVVGFHLKKD